MPTLDLLSADVVAPPVLAIVEAAPMPGLNREPNCSQTREAIQQLISGNGAIARGTTSPQVEALALAGLWLLAGELDRSHELSQGIESATGSYWHGIMHRREGDFWNSKYWFRRVGRHSVLEELAQKIAAESARLASVGIKFRQLCDAKSVAETLVDLCEAAETGDAALVPDLQLICWWEWQLLFRCSLSDCHRQ